jgi:hypothetical protein
MNSKNIHGSSTQLRDHCFRESHISIRSFGLVSQLRIKASSAIWLVVMIVLIGLPVGLIAQSTTGDIVGTVADVSGAIIPNATVTLVNTATKETHTVQTSSAGEYVFNLLNPGTYSIAFAEAGFKTVSIRAVTLAAGDREREDAKLTVGATSETVEVRAQAPALHTDSSALSSGD